MRIVENLAYAGTDNSNQVMKLYLPETESFDLFLYFHGGGLEFGNYLEYDDLASLLCKDGIAFASAEYRMFPNARYPDFIEDAATAAAWVKQHIGEYGNCKRIFIGGSSAGGYLSMMLSFDSEFLRAHGLMPTDFAGFLHDAGQPTAHYNCLKYRNLDPRRVIVDDTAPLFYVGLANELPEMLFIWSDNDIENRPEQSELMISTLKHFKYDMSKIHTVLMHGQHCQYVGNGEKVIPFAKIISDFICGKYNTINDITEE